MQGPLSRLRAGDRQLMTDNLSGAMRYMLRAMGSQQRFRWVLFLAAVVLCAVGASATITPARRQQAIDAFNKTEKMRTALVAQPEGKHRKEEFKQVIDAYYEVVRLNPAYAKTPVALQAIAELYRQMGREFSSDSYFLESIKTYRFLAEQYPKIHIARDAWFTIGEVYRQDLEDPDAARKAFQNFITMYPKSDKVDEAKNY